MRKTWKRVCVAWNDRGRCTKTDREVVYGSVERCVGPIEKAKATRTEQYGYGWSLPCDGNRYYGDNAGQVKGVEGDVVHLYVDAGHEIGDKYDYNGIERNVKEYGTYEGMRDFYVPRSFIEEACADLKTDSYADDNLNSNSTHFAATCNGLKILTALSFL